MSCGRTKVLLNQTTWTVANWDQNQLDFCGELDPSITTIIMNILVKWSYNEIFVFIFLLRWHFYQTTNEFLNMLYFYIWTNVNTKELMQFQYDTDAITTVNNHGLLEWKVIPRDWRCQCLLMGYQNMLWMPATQKTSYEIAARNNWNGQHVIFKYFPRLRGSCIV